MTALKQVRQRFRMSQLPAQRICEGDLRVFLAMPMWTIFRSTDREYIYHRFARLNEHWRLRFEGNRSSSYILHHNTQYLVDRVCALVGIPAAPRWDSRRISISGEADLIFAYGSCPVGASPKLPPIVWEHTFAPHGSRDADSWISQLRAGAKGAAARASRVVTATNVSAEWFGRIFPEHAHKVESIPYLLPDVVAISDEQLAAKGADDGPLRVLFVGKQGRRKGLDTLAQAWTHLSQETRRRISVMVVCSWLDGEVRLPDEWDHTTFVADLYATMRAAHVLAFPTKDEAYGLVLVEAMAAGCIPLTTSAETQRCIVGEDAGIFVDPYDASALANAIADLAHDRDQVRSRGIAARRQFLRVYDPSRVAEAYARLFWRASCRTSDDAIARNPALPLAGNPVPSASAPLALLDRTR